MIFRSLAYTSINKLPTQGMYHIEKLNVSGNKDLLYMPAIEVTPNLKILHAAYNYHCCAYLNNVSFECVTFCDNNLNFPYLDFIKTYFLH